MKNNLLAGKKGLITGVANDRSIAWGIAQMASDNGADLCFTYQNEVLHKRLEPLAKSANSDFIMECDATDDESMDNVFSEIEKKWGKLDFIVHSIAFCDKSGLRGKYVETSRENFLVAMNISCYSLTALTKRAEKLMQNGGSIVTLTYYGAEKVIPNYNVMGVAKAALETSVKYLASDLGKQQIRVNAISSGPIKTLAASGINDFRTVLGFTASNAPLRRNVTLSDIGGAALFLLSDLSSGVTGEIMHVDSGYNIIGMPVDVKEVED